MRTLLIILLLIATNCHAGPAARRFMQVMGPTCIDTSSTINCISSISSSGPTDTGTASFLMAAGNITAHAECACAGATSSIQLFVDGSPSGSLVCTVGDCDKSTTLTFAVASGTHSVRLAGAQSGSGTYLANSFSIPIP